MAISFGGTIKKVGINPCIDAPLRVGREFGTRGYIPVRGTINGAAFVQTLVPVGGGRHRLFINRIMLDAAGVEVGDRIEVTVRRNRSVRQEPVPPLFAKAMKASAVASATWTTLTPSRRKEILRYLNSAKRPQTLERNVQRTIAMLERRKIGNPLAAVRIPPVQQRSK